MRRRARDRQREARRRSWADRQALCVEILRDLPDRHARGPIALRELPRRQEVVVLGGRRVRNRLRLGRQPLGIPRLQRDDQRQLGRRRRRAEERRSRRHCSLPSRQLLELRCGAPGSLGVCGAGEDDSCAKADGRAEQRRSHEPANCAATSMEVAHLFGRPPCQGKSLRPGVAIDTRPLHARHHRPPVFDVRL